MSSSFTAPDYDYLFKLLLVGDSAVGKTSMVRRFADNAYDSAFISTIGVDFAVRTINVKGKRVKLQIWDTAGQVSSITHAVTPMPTQKQERFQSIISTYYRGAHGIFMVYDVTDNSSLKSIRERWIPEASQYCRQDARMMMVGNKADSKAPQYTKLIDQASCSDLSSVDAEPADADTAEAIRADFDLPPVLETSAKYGHNIEATFELMASKLMDQYVLQHNEDDSRLAAALKGTSVPVEDDGAASCCTIC